MNSSIFMVLFVTLFVKFCLAQQCNEKGMRQFDANMARLLTIANSGRSFPNDKGASLKKWCSESDKIVKDLEGHKTKCFKDLSKQVFGVLIFAIKNAMRQYCKKDSQKLNDIIAAVPCVEKNDPVVTKCYTNFIDGVLGAKNAVDSKKIPHMCCEISGLYKCFEDKLTKLPRCNEKHVESLNDLVRSIVGNVMDLICGDYVEDSDKCQYLGPPPKKQRSQKRTKSFTVPVLDLLSSFPAV